MKRNSIQGNKNLAAIGIEVLDDGETKNQKHSAMNVVNKVKNFFRLNEINSGGGFD
jgi:hypothetical protein